MKKARFTNKETNETKEYLMGEIGERVFALVYNVKETNDAIRWCNQHTAGDSYESEFFKIELFDI